MAIQNNGQPQTGIIFTDDKPGRRVFIGPNTPTGIVEVDIWLDADAFNNAGKNFISGVALTGSSANVSISFTAYKDVYILFRNLAVSSNGNITFTLNGNTTDYAPTASSLFSLSNVKTGITTNHLEIEIPDVVTTDLFRWASLTGVYTNTSDVATVVDTTSAFKNTAALTTLTLTASSGTLSGTALVYGVN